MKLFINKTQYGYSAPLVDKEKTVKYYLQLGFRKGEEPTTDQIEVNDSFMTAYNSKDGAKPKLVVMSYTELGNDLAEKNALYNTKATTKVDPYKDFGDALEITDDMLPF